MPHLIPTFLFIFCILPIHHVPSYALTTNNVGTPFPPPLTLFLRTITFTKKDYVVDTLEQKMHSRI
jgi:hypothetical protein